MKMFFRILLLSFVILFSYPITARASGSLDDFIVDKINGLAVCGHPQLPSVVLSKAELRGTLIVTSSSISTATKLDKMLRLGKVVELRVKASNKRSAIKSINKLQDLVAHANTYGIKFWFNKGCKVRNVKKLYGADFRKTGKYYIVTIPRQVAKNYVYCCTAFSKVIDKYYSGQSGYTFSKSTHLCDCSDFVKLYVLSDVFTRVHVHNYRYGVAPYDGCYYHRSSNPDVKITNTSHPFKDFWRRLAGNQVYGVLICQDFAEAVQSVGNVLGLKSKLVDDKSPNAKSYISYDKDHMWAVFNIKDSSGRVIQCEMNNAVFVYSDEDNYISPVRDDIVMLTLRYGMNTSLLQWYEHSGIVDWRCVL